MFIQIIFTLSFSIMALRSSCHDYDYDTKPTYQYQPDVPNLVTVRLLRSEAECLHWLRNQHAYRFTIDA